MCDTRRVAVESHDDHDNFDDGPHLPRCSPNKLTSNKSSLTLKETTDANSSLRCCGNEGSHPVNTLRKIPTSNFYDHDANANANDNLSNDNDNTLRNKNAQENMTLSSTFLQDWEAFYIEFKNSTTNALAHSSAASLLPSLVDDDDANDNQKMHECNIDKLLTNSSAGL